MRIGVLRAVETFGRVGEMKNYFRAGSSLLLALLLSLAAGPGELFPGPQTRGALSLTKKNAHFLAGPL